MLRLVAGGLYGVGKVIGKVAERLSPDLMQLAEVRKGYNEALDDLEAFGLSARAAGGDPEQIARMMNKSRMDIGKEFKNMTPLWERLKIYYRNIAPKWAPPVKIGTEVLKPKGYDTIYGPTVDWLRSKNKNWQQIIESATRTEPNLNRAAGVRR